MALVSYLSVYRHRRLVGCYERLGEWENGFASEVGAGVTVSLESSDTEWLLLWLFSSKVGAGVTVSLESSDTEWLLLWLFSSEVVVGGRVVVVTEHYRGI